MENQVMEWWAILLIVLGGVVLLIALVIIGFMVFLAATADSRQ